MSFAVSRSRVEDTLVFSEVCSHAKLNMGSVSSSRKRTNSMSSLMHLKICFTRVGLAKENESKSLA